MTKGRKGAVCDEILLCVTEKKEVSGPHFYINSVNEKKCNFTLD